MTKFGNTLWNLEHSFNRAAETTRLYFLSIAAMSEQKVCEKPYGAAKTYRHYMNYIINDNRFEIFLNKRGFYWKR